MLRETLEPELVGRGVHIDEPAWARLDVLLDLWRRYARAMNLTGNVSDEALVAHVHDGIATVACARRASKLEQPGPWIDVGSGGGFPGLVVAALVEAPVVLVEPRAKRAAFLELAVRAISRTDIGVSRLRIDRATWNQKMVNDNLVQDRMPFVIASARAVWGPAEWLKLGINLVADGGHVLVHVVKGVDEPILEASEHAEDSRKGRILAVRVSPALREHLHGGPK